ncbi:MAG: APC family permease [Chloroflexota bacterium]|nr:APC family permease [Chloroflexota bacterium]
MTVDIKRLILGKRLDNKDLPHQAISKPVGLAVFASDALSSTAYATQEILIILSFVAGTAIWTNPETVAGITAPLGHFAMPIAIAIAVLLTIVTISYRQTIHAYPNGGGAYIVARDNLGEVTAQVAGAALLTDYILTVAVSISAGVAQIVSAFPELLPFRVEIALLVILFMTVVNLRGVKESGVLFSIPTYFFLAVMFITLIIGFFRYATGTLPTMPPGMEVDLHHEAGLSFSLFLLLRAFSSGCTALTGIEAISNGITAFKEPKSKNAAITLVWMSSILIVLFLGITFLSIQAQVYPVELPTVIAQLASVIHGENTFFYFLVIAGTTLILLMAANTAYADFPRLAALHAGDGFLPRQLTYRGGRLVFSWGIMALAVFASLLIIISGASVTFLIPLYAVGVFLSFTISQAGMVVRYNKISKLKPGEVIKGLETDMSYEPSWRFHQIISAVGAVCTFVVMVIFAITKFTGGAWFIVVLVPVLVYIFFQIHKHYKEVAQALSLPRTKVDTHARPIQTLILIDNVHAETARMVNFAKSLGTPWKAIHIGTNPERAAQIKAKWDERIGEGTFEVIDSPLRLLAEPIREYVDKLLDETPDGYVHVIMGQLVMDTFWEQALHQNSAFIFNLALAGLERVVVTNVPYQIHHEHDAEGHDHMVAGEKAH